MVQIGLPNFLFTPGFRTGLTAFVLSILIVLSVVTKFNISVIFIVLILMTLIMIIMNSSRSTNYEDSLPSTTYPIPPHLGLDGVSLVNRR